MSEDLKAKVLNTHDIECRGVPTYNGLSLAEPVAALLTSRVDGTVEVACPHYKEFNEGKTFYAEDRDKSNRGTCRASESGNGGCTYVKTKPDSEVAE